MRLMVVDDNKQVREGISLGIDWKELGITEVRAYGDGLEAKRDLESFQPDLVIADIRMPNMDGLQLLKEVRAYSKTCRYILLSAYSEFSYAQQAVRLGANDYLLKPVKPQELVSLVMKNMNALLELRKESEDFYKVYEKSFLHSLLTECSLEDPTRLKQLLEVRYHMNLSGNRVFLAILRIENTELRMKKASVSGARKEALKQEIAKLGYVAEIPGDTLLFLGRGEYSQMRNQEIRNEMRNSLAHLNGKLAAEKIAVTSGISRVAGLHQVPVAFVQAREAMERTYYQKAGACVLYGEAVFEEAPSFSEARQKEYMEELAAQIKKGDLGKVEDILRKFLDEGMHKQYRPKEVMDFLKRLYLFLLRHTSIKSSLEFEQGILESHTHFELAINEFLEYVRQFLLKSRPLEEENYSSIIRNICVYMEEHFKEPLTVDAIAEKFNRTPNYVSAKFKREVGKSFTDYLVELRVQKALNLLMYTDLPIGEVAVEVGFGSYAYFSRIFRKYTGKSAGAFRENG